jgi:hypothetical protein
MKKLLNVRFRINTCYSTAAGNKLYNSKYICTQKRLGTQCLKISERHPPALNFTKSDFLSDRPSTIYQLPSAKYN